MENLENIRISGSKMVTNSHPSGTALRCMVLCILNSVELRVYSVPLCVTLCQKITQSTTEASQSTTEAFSYSPMTYVKTVMK